MMLNSGDTAWMLISTALVILMTVPGVAMFYSGLTKRENVLNTIFLSFVSLGIVSLLWFLFGYGLIFGGDVSGIIGSHQVGISLINLGSASKYAPTIPEGLFAIFQMTFAAITVALISGAVVERIKFSSWILFIPLWFALVYVPVAHWVWGGGFLQNLGVHDFAGGIVVHITSGIAALALALVTGPRYDQKLMPHHLGYSVIGTGLLWFGWFGFNAGSALSAGSLAANAMIVTNTSAAAGMIGWILMDRLKTGKPTLLGALSGAVAGLASITPAAGFVDIGASIVTGLVAAVICYLAVSWLKPAAGYDDALDVFGIHGVSGIIGTLGVGLFAVPALNPSLTSGGLLTGSTSLLVSQLIGVVTVTVYTFVVTYILAMLLMKFKGLRVEREEEIQGLDINLHEETGYRLT
ncbi:ammonium transporter [Methanothermobacter thermautotrophicus str. Delta H]|uniref:Putative ammonium transporter MTH_661 n=2 Tax=Methanothermobacter TaxID=145260 RepID=Y661_METTH|nr:MULTISPECIES: ammonium transporter [Methanothermobacter]O26757.1 RecName: Full=Putative ammonium transporter MTH_661 [Methanothermobacter thermautotrophicus str. Delta H]AAB85166.1 ammonium transporter [Methanothermobacter thermautotrophicus str. Delta H]WBF06902.1 ammonium transporter [Methanothermobacter thermautotrophicus]HOQ18525.1 ammonium transporter [Methanothermobacter thermautotrophicus]